MKILTLDNQGGAGSRTPSFLSTLASHASEPLTPRGIKVLQANLGYRCNMACRHCHVSAGRSRTETMEEKTADAVLNVLRKHPFETLDLTGGAPELNPHFRRLVSEARARGKTVFVRTNLTVFYEHGMEDLPEFYREQGVELIASLPCYLEQNVNSIRGAGTYARSIESLRRLNALGFGCTDRGSLRLSLVYNPAGPFLPAQQAALENDYRKELKIRHGISFTRLFAFTNMPVGRFRDSLESRGELTRYLAMLSSAFNPATLDHVMCRTLVNVGWDGRLYDCDFNQAAGIPVHSDAPQTIGEFDYERLSRRRIEVADHCFGCTAGQGST